MQQSIKVAVIVVTYNRADVTNLMFDSATQVDAGVDYELIVIDNQSRFSEFQRIERFFKYLVTNGQIQGRIQRSEKNRGFPGGNNIGIREALADHSFTHICLLNNDTVVTDGWLKQLVEVAGDNALVGPVSNSVGNEQVVPVSYDLQGSTRYTSEAVREFARKWASHHKKMAFPTEMLGFFCVLGSRQLFEKVGLLDEAFGVGTFEDDDYCVRVLKAGFKLLIARHVFVHHWGSATFGVLASRNRERLTLKNKTLFERKHCKEWKKPIDTVPVSLAQELESADEELLAELKPKFVEMLRCQIRGLDATATMFESKSGRLVVGKWLQFRISMLKGYWPKTLRLAVQFLVTMLFCGQKDRMQALKASREILRQWAFFGRNRVAHAVRLFRLRRLSATASEKQSIVILPIGVYEGRIQRAQHLARELARLGNRIIWIDPQHPIKQVGAGKSFYLAKCEKIGSGFLTIMQTSQVEYDNFYVTGIAEVEALALTKQLQRLAPISKLNFVIQSPFWAPFIARLRKSGKWSGHAVYDCMDDHLSFGSATDEVKMLEELTLNVSDKIVATSEHLRKTVQERVLESKPVALVRNAAQAEHFLGISKAVASTDELVVGYFGAIAEWFDHELVIQVGEAMPDVTFELIGNAFLSPLHKMELPKNIKMLGEQPYRDLPQLTMHWQVGLIPFKLTPLIIATNPVKMYEYSALGLPVVSTPIPEVLNSGLKVFVGATAEEFVEAIRSAIRSDSVDAVETRKSFALNNTWEARAKELLQFCVPLQ